MANMNNQDRNNFSYWFPKIQRCGIAVPKSLIVDLPPFSPDYPVGYRLWQAFFCENPEEDRRVIQEWLDENVLPKLKIKNLGDQIFVKNARFSNKFLASKSCLISIQDLASAVMEINYGAMLTGAGGLEELVIRERIHHNPSITPEIYGGLPLRCEFRVFYDFDERKPLYVVNYWDYDYVAPFLSWATDRIVFEHERERLEKEYETYKDKVLEMVSRAMERVDLEGQWSIDILRQEDGKFWLIDMAVAQQSAYWRGEPASETFTIAPALEESCDIETVELVEIPRQKAVLKPQESEQQKPVVPIPCDDVPLKCAICGSWLINSNAHGMAYASSRYNGTDVCDTCALDHCCATDCDQCDWCVDTEHCKFKGMKEYYTMPDDAG